MADAANATEGLDIQMQEVAGVRPLIPLNHGRRVEAAHAIQAGPMQDPGDRGARHAHAHADLPRGGALLAVGEDSRRARRSELAWLPMRARRPILERLVAVAAAAHPFRNGADADTRRGGGGRLGPALSLDPVNQEVAHPRRRLGITMQSHSEVPPETVG